MTNETKDLVTVILLISVTIGGMLLAIVFVTTEPLRILQEYDKCLTMTSGNKSYCGLPQEK